MYPDLLVVTSLIISAEAWHPLTICRVHRERSLVVSARNRCVSMPRRVPVRVAKKSSVPEWGDPRSGPEWTRLDKNIQYHIAIRNSNRVNFKCQTEHVINILQSFLLYEMVLKKRSRRNTFLLWRYSVCFLQYFPSLQVNTCSADFLQNCYQGAKNSIYQPGRGILLIIKPNQRYINTSQILQTVQECGVI